MPEKSPFRKLPNYVTFIACLFLFYIWFNFSELKFKIIGFIVSCGYSLLEYTWVGLTVEKQDGTVEFDPFNRNRRKPKTVKLYLSNKDIYPIYSEYSALTFAYPLVLSSTFYF